MLNGQIEENRRRQRTTGSMFVIMQHPFFAEIITYRPALDALARLGYPQPTFTDGYIISKPAHSPRLFWHYDWFAWEEERNYQPEPPQVFLMIYLHDTCRENGCLRVIPGSHCNHNPLQDVIDEPHAQHLQAGHDLTSDDFSDRPDEIDVPIKAGDLLIGDSRLLHATHANTSDQRRTVLTLWYQTDLPSLPEKIQAQMVAKTQEIPADWDVKTPAPESKPSCRATRAALSRTGDSFTDRKRKRLRARTQVHYAIAGNPLGGSCRGDLPGRPLTHH